MPTELHWTDAALRLALSVLAGMVIGYDRSEQGKASGMRTTVLVCLAASVAMIEVNLLLPLKGRPSDSFVMNDLMRLPLGILTGVGFIGAGAILRRDDIVVGLTTAATLWLVTVIGLCFGAGLLGLGLAAAGLGVAALWPLRWFEARLHQEHSAHFSIELGPNGPDEIEIRRRLNAAEIVVIGHDLAVDDAGNHRRIALEVRRYRRFADTSTPRVIADLLALPGVLALTWKE
jgi:putative Mg2+ transporter-C (MgtC) family protein